MKLQKAIVVALAATAASVSSAATFDVSTPAEFEAALTTAQANGESDTINVAAGTYNLSTTLSYTAVATENFSLVIEGTDSAAVTLNGGLQLPILRINTTAVTDDSLVFVRVRNMTFENGSAAGADGGALAIIMDDSNQPAVFASQVLLAGSEFYGNTASGNGGAVFIRSPATQGIFLDDLTFDGNTAGGDGGAVHVSGRVFGTPISINNIDFFNNTAAGSGGGLYAGGYDVDTPSETRATAITLTNTTFYNNQSNGTAATDGGGGADIGASGVITVRINGFIDNDARTGAGLRVRPNFGEITMVNNGFTNNTAAEDGGGVAASNSIFAAVTMTNNTIYANTATNRGGGVFLEFGGSSSFADFYNNILFRNTAQQGAGDDLYVNNDSPPDIPGFVNVFNNDITDIEVTPGPFSQGDNIDLDPLLADITVRPEPDPRLLSGSPAIDAGLNEAPSAPAFDFESDTRPRDGDGDGTATIDIGMDEFTGAVAQNVDLRVTKAADAEPVIEGSDLTYTVTVTNLGTGNASSVSMVDTLPGLLGYLSATPSQGACSEALGVINCGLGAMDAGASATVTIVASTPDVPDTTVVSNTATVSGPEPDPDTTNNTVTLDTTIVPAGPVLADVAVTKEALVGFFAPELDYAITVSNNGPNDATGVVLTDTLPALVDFESANATVGTCAHDSGVVTCNIGALANGASSDITIRVLPQTVDTDTDITNTATVTAAEEDPTPANNTATATTTIFPPMSSLGVSIESRPLEPVVNEQITYDVRVGNFTGIITPDTATNVVLTIELPAGATLVSVTPEQGSCDVDGSTITCTLGDVPGDAAVMVEVVVTAPGVAGTITLSATASTDTDDMSPEDNVASWSVNVIDVIDLVIEGSSEGSGSVGWIELLMLTAAAGAIAVARRLQSGAVALVAIATLPFVALLAADEAYAESDWYVGAAVGQADIDYSAADLTSDLASLGWTIEGATVDHSDTAWKLYGGWAMNKYFALELGWVDLGKVTTRYSATIAPNEITSILADTARVHPLTGDGVTAAAVLRWPFAQNFAVHAKAGLFAWESDIDVRVVQGGTGQALSDDSGVDAMYGLGLEWKLTDRWSLTAEWERYQLNDWVDTPSVGVRFTF